jgi:hypothetical protein
MYDGAGTVAAQLMGFDATPLRRVYDGLPLGFSGGLGVASKVAAEGPDASLRALGRLTPLSEPGGLRSKIENRPAKGRGRREKPNGPAPVNAKTA